MAACLVTNPPTAPVTVPGPGATALPAKAPTPPITTLSANEGTDSPINAPVYSSAPPTLSTFLNALSLGAYKGPEALSPNCVAFSKALFFKSSTNPTSPGTASRANPMPPIAVDFNPS